MANTLLRRALLPPAAAGRPGAERVRLVAWARAIVTFAAALGNVGVFAILAGSEGIRAGVSGPGCATNVLLLGGDAALTLLFLRQQGRFYTPILRLCLLMEIAAGTLWLQLTGSVSSYYIGAGFILIVLYRLATDYSTGLLFAGGTFAAHWAIFLCEEAGVLKQASLFVAAPAGLYGASAFRWAAMFSMSWIYGTAFAAGNFVATLLSERDRAVDQAEAQARRAVEEARPGRLSGQTLAGRYLLGEVIGRGGMGEVYQGVRVADRKSVAIKVLHTHMAHHREARERFRREALIAGRLPPGHVPELIEFAVSEDGRDFLAMELIIGEDLSAVLRRRALTTGETVALCRGIAAGLDAAHAAGIVHRDLKPSNVLLVGGDVADVRLVDFGVARLLEAGPDEEPVTQLTQGLALIGTPGYLAPEQAWPTLGPVGPATDVFALGAIAYRALTGHPAFPARHAAAAIEEALNRHPAPASALVPGLPADVDVVLALALAKSIESRYASAGELAADLAAALAGTLLPATRERAARLPRAEAPAAAFEPTMAVDDDSAAPRIRSL